jgi:carbon monoxide dehydrogenase subunit G
MKMTGDYTIPAPQQKVWDGLNDPAILQQAVPGCESIERSGDNEFAGVVRAKVGPVSAKFRGKVTLSELDPPNSCLINGEGTGGAAGFAKGSARVVLKPEGEGTHLSYEVDANVGGKLAQIGQRFIDSTAKKMADDFFAKFGEVVGAAGTAPEPALAAAEPERVETTSTGVAHDGPSHIVIAPVGEGTTGGNVVVEEDDSVDHGTGAPPAPSVAAPEDSGLAVEAAGETRGFSPMVWVPVLLIVLIAIVLLFLRYT